MIIAVASKTGKSIDQHFGHAERFFIYEVTDGKMKLVEEKQVEKYCSFDQEHPLRGHILRAISEALAGCRAVVCLQIGQAPQMEMERLGLEVFTCEGPVEEVLPELASVL